MPFVFHVEPYGGRSGFGAGWGLFKLQLASLGGVLFVSLAVTWIILYYVRLLDHPNERSSHKLATPKCGGVGIVSSFAVGVLVSHLWEGGGSMAVWGSRALLIPLLLIAMVSLIDDIRELSPGLRLLVQGSAAGLLIWLGGLVSLAGTDCTELNLPLWAMIGAAGLWLIGMANAFNFMDGIDGLAAGEGAIAAFFFGVIQFIHGNGFLGFSAFALTAGCLGFLAFNFPPAKVFMGDVGSVSIGFILASLALLSLKNNWTLEAAATMPLLVSNFIFDTVTTFARRLFRGERVWQAHRDHLYQKFAGCGFSQRTVTMTNYGMAILQGMVVLMLGSHFHAALLACLLLQVLYAWFIYRSVQKCEPAIEV